MEETDVTGINVEGSGDGHKGKCHRVDVCAERVKRFLSSLFGRYGTLVGTYPLPFILIPVIVFGGLGAGMVSLDIENNIEKIYFPADSRAFKERAIVRKVFSSDNYMYYYNRFSRSDPVATFSLLFFAKGESLLESKAIDEIKGVVATIEGFFSYACMRIRAKRPGDEQKCAIDGAFVTEDSFLEDLSEGNVTYPSWTDAEGVVRDVSEALADVVTKEGGGVLVSAKVLHIVFKMANTEAKFEKEFSSRVSRLKLKYSKVNYAYPGSLENELENAVFGDIVYFVGAIVLCFAYTCLVCSGGDPVSTRLFLALAGVLTSGLSLAGSMGLLSLCGVKMVDIVGVLPFLIIGIGIDDMFLLMSSYSDTLGNTELTVPQRIGACMSSAGVGITITSFTDTLAFAIGTASIFPSVTNFSIYAGLTVLFCYVANATFFLGCLTIHARRVYSNRHFLTCRPTTTRQRLKENGARPCTAWLCGGAPPQEKQGDESLCECFPHRILPKVISRKLTCVVIVLCFMVYLVVVIYGAANLQEGLLLHNLVPSTSYYYDYLLGVYTYFPESLPIGFIVDKPVNYSGAEGRQLLNLLGEARQDPMVVTDFQRCWLASYLNSSVINPDTDLNSTLFPPPFDRSTDPNATVFGPDNNNNNNSSDYYNGYDSNRVYGPPPIADKFVRNLRAFLEQVRPDFDRDVVIDDGRVRASRCFVMSEKSNDQYARARLMSRLRAVADRSPLPAFVYHFSFLEYEQYLAITPATLQMLGCAVLSMTVVTALFLPHPLMVALVVLTILMILTGIVGIMYFWGITLSVITMIHLLMSVGFSVDFSAHVCAAYLMSGRVERHERAVEAVHHASTPIVHGATSTTLGVLLLALTSSYIFITFFKIMVLVMVLGLLHAAFFLPACLALVGPRNPLRGKPRACAELPATPTPPSVLMR